MREILADIERWRHDGRRVAVARVVNIEGSGPRDPGASMAVNLCWPREEFYGAKWYQHYGPITGVAVVMIGGLILYYGYQQHRMEILPEHRADAGSPPEPQAAPGTL